MGDLSAAVMNGLFHVQQHGSEGRFGVHQNPG